MKPYFSDETKFYVVGDYDKYKFPSWVIDKRVNEFNKKNNIINNKIFSESIITLGLLGSSMIIPSILSKMTVHLFLHIKIIPAKT